MKIYFAGAIRGGRDDSDMYMKLIEYINTRAEVLTEHIGDKTLSALGETTVTEEYIFDRDVAWIKEADAIIAEVSTTSLGVGYELGLAESLQKPILCLYRPQEDKRLSAMVRGNKKCSIREYSDLQSAKLAVDEFVTQLQNSLSKQ